MKPLASTATAFASVVKRDLLQAARRPGEWLQPLAFFVIVTVLFPLSLDPEMARLRYLAPAALWVALLLSSLLALEFLFREDARDGTLEQFALSAQPFAALIFAKTATHWLLTGLPLSLVGPLAAISLGAPPESALPVLWPLLLGSLSMSLIGSICAGLTLGARRGGALLSLLVLPLAMPTLVFGARAVQLAIAGEGAAGPLYLLGALTVLGLTLAPLAAAAAVRISLE
ncbi:MAG: heme exporter protein CcmB [Nevskiaceae bacterium]|jgi:heme exporter protein B|nr:heme exporter protein CcmB [Nevskiaceae bacterium]